MAKIKQLIIGFVLLSLIACSAVPVGAPTPNQPTPNIGVQKAMLVLKAVGIGKQGSTLLDANRLEEALKAYGEAIEALDAALAIDPTDRAVWCSKGTTLLVKSVVLYKLDQTDEGHKVLGEAVEALKKGSPCEEFGVVFSTPTP